VLLGIVVPAVALVVIVAFNLRRSAGLGAAVAAVVVVATAVAIVIARSISRPIATLAEQAADVAVLQQAEGRIATDELLPPRPLDTDFGGELGDLANAIATGRRRALGIVTEQRLQHRSLRELATNMTSRSNDVLGAALTTIDDLARRDHDPASAATLATVQRLVARADRHTGSVLVLLGEGGRVAGKDTPITDVVWAACLAVGATDRIDLVSMADSTVRADAVGDLAHLIAEMLENAAHASEGDQRVSVLGESTDVGYLVTVVDHGGGMDAVALAEANRRVARAVPVNQVPGRALGLDVVGRLARRHGILVRLGESSDGGIVVRVEIPASLVVEPAAVPDTIVDLAGAEADETRDAEPWVTADVSTAGVETTAPEPAPVEVPIEVPIEVIAPEPVAHKPVANHGLADMPAASPSIVVDPMPYVVRVRPVPIHGDELLPNNGRKKRWAAALAKAGQ
jgi:signal transduction histidine kinase